MLRTAVRSCVLASLAACLCAQEYRATLVGNVTDQSGAAVALASVSVSNIATGVQAATKADNEGNFVVPFLVPGRYEVTVNAAGFKAFSRSPIELRVNDRARVDVRLEIGQATEK